MDEQATPKDRADKLVVSADSVSKMQAGYEANIARQKDAITRLLAERNEAQEQCEKMRILLRECQSENSVLKAKLAEVTNG